MEIILSIITGVLSLLLGGGGILYYKETKKNKQLENCSKLLDNDDKVSDSWQDFAMSMKATCDDKDKIVAELNSQIKILNNNINEIYKELNSEIRLKEKIERELDATGWWKCTRVGCTIRKPPLGTEETPTKIAI